MQSFTMRIPTLNLVGRVLYTKHLKGRPLLEFLTAGPIFTSQKMFQVVIPVNVGLIMLSFLNVSLLA